jgi:hypothetical protein
MAYPAAESAQSDSPIFRVIFFSIIPIYPYPPLPESRLH